MLTQEQFDALLATPWPLPVLPPLDADTYQREAIADAQSPDDEPSEDIG